MDMDGCGRRGVPRPHSLCYNWKHFPVPGIGAGAGLDLGKYLRQYLAGPKFDFWCILLSIKEVQACKGVQEGCLDLLLVWAICYVIWQNVICPVPPPPACSFWGSKIEGQQVCPPPWHKRLSFPLCLGVCQAVATSCLHSLTFFVHILHIVICFPCFEITQNF